MQATVRQLKTLVAELKTYQKRIAELFQEHPDAELFGSLPGAGKKLAPRLATLFGEDRERFASASSVQELSGVAPVTMSSGNTKIVRFRWACKHYFRNLMHQFAWCSIRHCDWARNFYKYRRKRGDSNALAIRNLAYKWVKIIYRMWVERKPYDNKVYLDALAKHNSPVAPSMPDLKELKACG